MRYINSSDILNTMKNALKWGQKQVIEGSTRQSAYYDFCSYKVPFIGEYDHSKIFEALYKHFPQRFTKFGGFTTVSEIEQMDDKHVRVELCYHIGD